MKEAAALTGFSTDTITRMFEREPGVLIIERATTMRKRRYRSMRIPLSVFDRVLKRITIRVVIFALTFGLVALMGCESGHDAKLQEAEQNFAATLKSQQDGLQWKLDDTVAVGIFSESRYLTFRKCHETPPTHAENKRVCADLQSRVAKQEAKNEAVARREKAAW